jgi:hypothetical protein
MIPLAKFWTWLGQYFVPIAIAWGYFVRNGADEGVKISRGYWGLIMSLLVGAVLIATFALYARRARVARTQIVPPNMTFESEADRNLVLSWGTVAVFHLAVIIAIVLFGNRYASSEIYRWEERTPIARSFWESRARSRAEICAHEPCFSMGKRFDNDGKELQYVDQYFPYLTDGSLIALFILLIGAIVYLIFALLLPSTRPIFPNPAGDGGRHLR